jgi:hypothetical protein
LLKQVAAIVFVCSLLAAQTATPERKVESNVITSERDPAVRVHVPNSAQYVGADRWVLYGLADCELHAFVDADPKNDVRRLYWVQFEGYLPTRPELQYQYDSPRRASIGGLEFYVDTWIRTKDATLRSGSDAEHVAALLRRQGYHMPDGMMYVRLVHLLDEPKRKELMIIYGEDVRPSGLSAAELQPGGKAHDRWPEVENSLLQRAEKSVAIEPTRP